MSRQWMSQLRRIDGGIALMVELRRKQERPLLMAWLADPGFAEELRSLGYDVELVSSLEELLGVEHRRTPRLFILQPPKDQRRHIASELSRLHHERPLTEILLWIPDASPNIVRTCFLAGAQDVVLGDSRDVCVKRIAELLNAQKLLPRLNELTSDRGRNSSFESMLSRSQPMWDLFDLCVHVAQADATVLIVGETGTGKELLARAIHRRSGRKGRFVAANCASIAPELINSELFGYEKGAFTGAERTKKGLVSHADRGTLFLDEIGDMPAEAQQSLLRMLQEKRIRPVGSLVEIEIDTRVVAATNVPLDQAVRAGNFREDLFYRLDVIRMNVPPLRERPEDILFLFGHFTKRLAKQYGLEPPTFADSFIDALLEYQWPGNVRQLENFSERLILARPLRALTRRDFSKLRSTSLTGGRSAETHRQPTPTPVAIDTSKPLHEVLDPLVKRTEMDYLCAVLDQHQGRISKAAEHAGINRRTLLRKMKSYGLDKTSFRD